MNVVEHFQGRITDSRSLTFLPDVAEPVRLTFTELDRRARATATWLTSLGMTDRPVLLLYPPGLEFTTAFLGCLYARVLAIPAPLPQAGPQHLARVRALAADSGAQLILTGAAQESRLADRLPDIPVRAVDPQADPDGWIPPDLSPGTTAYLQYTSGSTSEPRGVVVSHGGLLHNLGMIHSLAGANPPTTLTGWLPHYHDMGLIGLQLHALYAGADLVFTAPASFVARPVRWLEMISRYRAEWTVSPDFGYSWCARRVTDDELAGLDLFSLAMAFNGAEPIRADTLAAFERRFTPIGFQPSAWVPCYGMAEATLLITGVQAGRGATIRRFDPGALEQHRAEPATGGVALVSSGTTVDLDLRIVDPHTQDELPERRVGEIWVAGASVALGYLGRADATKDTFHAGGGSYLRTGDLGFLHKGELYVTGRLKDVIIVNGRNLYPQDLEAAAREAHAAAGSGAAFSIARQGGREHVVLVLEVHRRRQTAVSEVADAVLDTLTRDFGIALSLLLVDRGGVLKTTSGKVRRRHMRERFLDGLLTPLHQELT